MEGSSVNIPLHSIKIRMTNGFVVDLTDISTSEKEEILARLAASANRSLDITGTKTGKIIRIFTAHVSTVESWVQ